MTYVRAHGVEILAVVFSLISVLLTIKENMWLWITGILAVMFYAVVFAQERFYAQMGLQLFFLGLQIYGWKQWLRGGINQDRLRISRSSATLNSYLLVTAITGTLVMAYLLAIFTADASLPFWDALLTVLSLIAQWMLAKKYLENWLVWITVDVISIVVYWYQGLRPSALLYSVFLGLAILGFWEWKKTFKSLQPA